MANAITSEIISSFKTRLEDHPVYNAVETVQDLQCFMEHHIYSVWDFMSLIKYLQAEIAPTVFPWTPQGDGNIRRFINELVLEEESDEAGTDGEFCSHVELYLKAMDEVGANTAPVTRFIEAVRKKGIEKALAGSGIPSPSRVFTSTTFDFIQENKAHRVAAALALGREHIIPCMFRSILQRIGISEHEAPIFHYYLNRHIHLDEDFHAPLSLELLNRLCEGEQTKIREAIDAANSAVGARIVFWDGVLDAINLNRQ